MKLVQTTPGIFLKTFLYDFPLIQWTCWQTPQIPLLVRRSLQIGAGQVPSELEELLQYLRDYKFNSFLEIGTFLGGTLFVWPYICSDNATIVTVDLPYSVSKHRGVSSNGYPSFRKMLFKKFKRANQCIIPLQENSHSEVTRDKVKNIFNGQVIDALLIDGDHSAEGAAQDFELYAPLVRKGGIILIHDISYKTTSIKGGGALLWQKVKEGRFFGPSALRMTFSNIREICHRPGSYGFGILKVS